MFVASDRTSKLAFAELQPRATKMLSADFLRRVLAAIPYKVPKVLTDNGTQFGNMPHQVYAWRHIFDRVCDEHGVEHCFTRPAHPWTNGQVERFNRTRKEATVKRYHYQTTQQLNEHLQAFLLAYNHAKRLKRLRGKTPHEFVCQQWQLNSTIFIRDPTHLTLGLYSAATAECAALGVHFPHHLTGAAAALQHLPRHPVADTLLGYVLTPLRKMALALWDFLPNLIAIVVIVTVFRYVLRGVHFLKEEIRLGCLTIDGFYPDWANPTCQIVRVLVFAFLLVVIFPYLPGSESPGFKGVSVFLGFLFTFGSAGSLSNIVAGLVLTYMRAYKLGDRVKIGDVTGDIIEKNLLVTRIRTIKNEEITIPNSSIMSS